MVLVVKTEMCRDLGDKRGASDFVCLSLVSSLAQIACFAPVREKTTLTFIIRRENPCGIASASSADNTPILQMLINASVTRSWFL